jgi:hypothetical protein
MLSIHLLAAMWCFAATAHAHMSIWCALATFARGSAGKRRRVFRGSLTLLLHRHPSMYGVGPGFAYDAGGSPVDPLGPDLATQDEWWFRGPRARALPPQDGAVLALPAGGSITFEIAVRCRF